MRWTPYGDLFLDRHAVHYLAAYHAVWCMHSTVELIATKVRRGPHCAMYANHGTLLRFTGSLLEEGTVYPYKWAEFGRSAYLRGLQVLVRLA